MKSVYRWDEIVCEDDEVLLTIKTVRNLWENLQTMVEKNHPYDVPVLTMSDMAINQKAEKWMMKVLTY